jgi:uncharacterized membrane protein YqjE
MHFIFFFYFDKIKYAFITFAYLSIVLLIFNIWFLNEAFAMTLTENTIEDYYGDKEYVGKDSYAHFHKLGLHNHGTVFLYLIQEMKWI